ncbi:hypothetical protein PVAP13_8NG182001 [Panicum virgatum]|uniref:Uncharacterized protein n=1 Tax=Panicum virgatum TaxID=38727 RepID=A0A8T0PD78_PANVG|nr:hypothetical protein PVAP13_8NG182001 [Panicum virgatum]
MDVWDSGSGLQGAFRDFISCPTDMWALTTARGLSPPDMSTACPHPARPRRRNQPDCRSGLRSPVSSPRRVGGARGHRGLFGAWRMHLRPAFPPLSLRGELHAWDEAEPATSVPTSSWVLVTCKEGCSGLHPILPQQHPHCRWGNVGAGA